MQKLKIIILLLLIVIINVSFNNGAFAYPIIGIRINDGAKYTNDPAISVVIKSLKLPEKLVDFMQIDTTPEFSNSSWIPYHTDNNEIFLPEGDGAKKVYVRLKDKSGNISPAETAEIILDTQPPENVNIVINNGNKFTNNKKQIVSLLLNATGAVKVQLSESDKFNNAKWVPFDSTKQWILSPPGDGIKFVYARFSDEAGNISKTVNDDIILDTEPPKNTTILISEDEKYTKKPQVKILLKANDAAKVRIMDRSGQSKTYDFSPNHENGMMVDWLFDSLQGIKMVRAYFMDEAGNITNAPAQDDIIYDAEGPRPCSIIIDNGNEYTNDPDGKVQVKLLPKENPSNIFLLISNHSDFHDSKPTPFQPLFNTWKLESETDGEKTVYVQLIDEAGNSSETAKKEIILDRKKPVINTIRINDDSALTNNPKVNLKLDIEGANKMQIVPKINAFNDQWMEFINEIPAFQLPLGDGEKQLYFRFMDQAGNISDTSMVSIKLDTSPPKGYIQVQNGVKFTNQPLVALKIGYDDATHMQLSNKLTFESSEWQETDSLIAGWKLEGDDGIKDIFLRLKDEAGNISPVLNTKILLDRVPPQNCRMLINNGAEWFNRIDLKVTLLFSAKGADSILVSNDKSFTSAKWIQAKPTIGWTLPGGGDGLKIVYSTFKDKAGNQSEIIADSIRVDTKAPVVNNFMINNGDDFTNASDNEVELAFDIEEANFMYISNDPIEEPLNKQLKWIEYKDKIRWKLKEGDGVHTIHVIFKDFADNLTQVATDHIILDRTPPVGARLFINNNKTSTNDPVVQLRMIAKEASQMMISNDVHFDSASWRDYTHGIKWKLKDNEDGKKLVYAKFKDKVGNISEAIYDDILLDRQPPSNPKVILSQEESADEVILKLSAENATSMIISHNAEFKNAVWEDFQEEKKIKIKDTDTEIYVKFKDDADNESAIVSQKINKSK